MMDEFARRLATRHEYARDWKKRTGGKVLGYLCCHVPEEIPYAAGILPVRILSSHEPQDLSELHIFGMYCPYCRDLLGEGLKGRYNYIDGLIMGRSCMHLRHTFDSWRKHLPVSFTYHLDVPSMVETASAKPYLTAELADFKAALEEWTGRPIAVEALDRAIQVYNANRRLMRQIYELRRGDPPLLTGAEAMEMVLSSMVSDKAEHNRLLEEALRGLPRRQGGPRAGVRLMVIGGENDDPELLRLVEELGANVVIDDLCMGSRYFWNPVEPEADRLAALASRHLDRPSCPVKDISNFTQAPRRRRFEHVLGLIQDYNVRGGFLIQQKFCDPQEFDIPAFQQLFKARGFPTYFIELDTTLPRGQLRTRTEAFLEMLELELV